MADLTPDYKEMLSEVGKQLMFRKSLLVKRILLISWPAIIYAGLSFLLKNYINEKTRDSNPELFVSVIVVFIIVVLLTILYVFIVSAMFSIEKRIWVDSYFDGKNLSGEQSWRIARKLFFPIIYFYWRIFVRYYFLPICVFISFFVGIFILFFVSNLRYIGLGDSFALIPLAIVWFGAIVFVAYIVYLRIKLRYSYFLFLDMYAKENFSYKDYFDELNKLNNVAKSETFKKALLVNLGADSLNTLSQSAIDMIASSMIKVGRVGDVIGQAGRAVASEAAFQVTDFGRIAALYILYKFVRKNLYGEEQFINKYIYKLAE